MHSGNERERARNRERERRGERGGGVISEVINSLQIANDVQPGLRAARWGCRNHNNNQKQDHRAAHPLLAEDLITNTHMYTNYRAGVNEQNH